MAKLDYILGKVKFELFQEERKMRMTYSDGTVKEYVNLKAVEPMDVTEKLIREI